MDRWQNSITVSHSAFHKCGINMSTLSIYSSNNTTEFTLKLINNKIVMETQSHLKGLPVNAMNSQRDECYMRKRILTAFPGTLQQIKSTFYSLPVLKMKESIGNCFTITPFQNMFWR